MKNIETEFNRYANNQKYVQRYLKYIKYCASKNIGENLEYTERHHILPKGKNLYPEFANLRTHPWNSIILTPRQHYIAHWILSKIFIETKPLRSCLNAFYQMSNSNSRYVVREYTARQYARCREAMSIAMQIDNPMRDPEISNRAAKEMRKFYQTERGIERRKQMSDYRRGVDNISDEAKKYLSELAKQQGLGKKKTAEQIRKQREAISIGTFHTPFGVFISVNSAVHSPENKERISGWFIGKWCHAGINGYSFTPKLK